MPLPIQLVANQGQFVGLKFYIGQGDAAIKINSLQLFFTTAASFNLYLYNDFFLDPIKTIPVTVSAYQETIIDLGNEIILNNLVPTQYKGGRWYLGYFQNDLPADCQAVYYPCGVNSYHPLTVLAYSAPLWIDPNGNTNFQRNNIGANNLMYGMNCEVSTFVDATNTIVQNSHLFDELIGLVMAARVVKNLIFSYQTNGVQRAIGSITQVAELYAQINGVKVADDIPYVEGLKNQIYREIKRVKAAFQVKKVTSVGTA